ncbi:MAG TPA: MFS transporter [Actinomycetota bacterium]|jgi:MFS family permease|nr:MFS transporter [Actinomycetota bacterium]
MAEGEVERERTSRLRRIAVDVTPLRVSRDYRRLWLGLLASTFGSQFTIVATYLQVYELTESTAAVGLLGLVGFVGLVAGTLAGSTFLDAFDRRKILIASQVGYLGSSGLLFAGALQGDPPLALIYVAVAGIAATSAIDSPTRSAITPRLIDRSLLPAAAALNQVLWNGAGLIGPALAGIVVGAWGYSWAYAIDLISVGLLLLSSMLIRPLPPAEGERATVGWRAVREGFAFLRGRKVLQSTFVIDIIAMVFGMPRALFPILALTQFHRGPEVVGLLFAAPAVGAFLGAATTGWVGRIRHQGLAVIWAVVVWGAGIAAFGLVGSNLWLGLFLLAVAGAADVISAVFRNTILQVTVPENLRGRLFGIHILVVTGGPRLGDLEAGLVAAAFGPIVSVVSGGLLCIVGAGIVAWRVPAFRRYHAGDPG